MSKNWTINSTSTTKEDGEAFIKARTLETPFMTILHTTCFAVGVAITGEYLGWNVMDLQGYPRKFLKITLANRPVWQMAWGVSL
jgi:hypothetical protein